MGREPQKQSQQRIIAGKVQMLAKSEMEISRIKVWVHRKSEDPQKLFVRFGGHKGSQVG